MWSILANPHRFMAFSKLAAPIAALIGLALFGYSLWQGLYVVPTDEVQGGDIFRAMFVHVPSAWLCMG